MTEEERREARRINRYLNDWAFGKRKKRRKLSKRERALKERKDKLRERAFGKKENTP